jgi:hypothetical protein
MHHHHDVRTRGQRFSITSLLVAPVAIIGIVNIGGHAQLLGKRRRAVVARVVDQDADIYNIRQPAHRLLQRSLGVVSGHHHRNPLPVNHSLLSPTWLI